MYCSDETSFTSVFFGRGDYLEIKINLDLILMSETSLNLAKKNKLTITITPVDNSWRTDLRKFTEKWRK